MPNPGKLIESEFGQWVSAGGLSSAAESRCSWRSAVFIQRLHNGLASAALGLFGFQTGRAAPAWGVPTLKCTVPTPEPNHTAHAKTLFMSQPSTSMPVILWGEDKAHLLWEELQFRSKGCSCDSNSVYGLQCGYLGSEPQLLHR